MLKSFAFEGTIYSNGRGKVICGFGKRHWTSKPQGFSWYFPDYFLTQPKPFFTQETTFLTWDELAFEDKSSPLPWVKGDFTPFDSSWTALQSLKKVVPYAELSCCHPVEPMAVLQKAVDYHRKTAGTTLYGFWGPEGGMIGVTPELLCRVEKESVHTVACAGTAKEGGTLLTNPKLRDEHQWVIEGIRESLQLFGLPLIGETCEKGFGRLYHLVTDICCPLQNHTSFLEVVSALHPTPALGAFPKKEGMEWLVSFDRQVPRGRFGAPAGHYHAETGFGECVVAIRNVQWNPHKSSIFCGAGITSASNREAEKEEVSLKWQAVREIIGC